MSFAINAAHSISKPEKILNQKIKISSVESKWNCLPDSYLNYLAPAVKQTDNLKVPEVSLIAAIVAVSKKGVNKNNVN